MSTADSRREKLALAQFTRSSDWPKVRRRFLKLRDRCEACGARKRLQAHHIFPYHLFPSIELDTMNLIPLCEGPANHHLMVGHLMSWKSYNENVRDDAKAWRERIENRPKWKQIL